MGAVNARIARLRTQRGLSQRRLADLAGISSTYINRIELGEREPSLEKLEQIAGALGTSVQYLRTGRRGTNFYLSEADIRILVDAFDRIESMNESENDAARLYDRLRGAL